MPTRDYRNANGDPVPSVSKILKKWGDTDGIGAWSNLLGRQGVSYHDEMKHRAAVGTLAHWYHEVNLVGDDAGPMPDVSDAMGANGFGAFATSQIALDCSRRLGEWWDAQGWTAEAVELAQVHEGMQYGGTLDCMARTPGSGLVCIDWKTSAAPRQKHRIQLSAYIALWNANHPDDPCNLGMIVCAPYTGGPVEVSKVQGKRLSDYTAAFGYLRMAYGALSTKEKTP